MDAGFGGAAADIGCDDVTGDGAGALPLDWHQYITESE